ncbi:hypothetical protein MUB24_03000 [Lederbergia sp. NSJ-179]|uniref:SPOR domain-containing protein n=1 Tax=Lederbergia sp. NSJ-179 TaxID=2931402 RepID=UPI001FD4452E|nr:SPOR domain-containing protein [Lederbergia sp. NSJ-179]MCJ7839897.1 hypothetical protein [Lederbergia sp. NSJ-179]
MEEGKNSQKATIKIKLNGSERPFEEETVIHDWKAASDETSAASSEEMLDEEFEWILPNEEEEQEVPEFKVNHQKEPKKQPYFHRNGNSPLKLWVKRLILSFVLAITVGLLLGSFLLKMMSQTDTQATTNEQNRLSSENKKEEGTTASKFEVKLPALTLPVLQAGVYSSKEAADAKAKELANQNQAQTILEMDEKYYLFLGVAGDLQKAKTWEKDLKHNGLEDVWAKELNFEERYIELASKEQSEHLLKEIEYFQTIIGEPANIKMGGEVNNKVIQEGLQLMKADKDLIYQNKEAASLQEKLQTAIKSLEKTAENSAETVKAQQALLDYISIYFTLSTQPT